MKVTQFAARGTDQKHQAAAAEHLLTGGEKGRTRVLRFPCVERADRPDERRNEQDHHADPCGGRLIAAGNVQRWPDQHANSDEPDRETKPGERSWAIAHSEQPHQKYGIKRDRRDEQRRKSGGYVLLGESDASVAAEEQTSTDNPGSAPREQVRTRRATLPRYRVAW